MEGMTPADVRAVMDGRDNGYCGDGFGFGGGGGWGIILLFALLFGFGGGGWGNNRNGNPVTEADLCNANSFTELKQSVARNGTAINDMYTGLQNGLCNLGYTNLQNFSEIKQQVAACCCEIKSAIDNVRFEIANYTAGINANTVAVGQKILDKLCENEKAAMAARIQQLELQQALCGVVRYPTTFTYNAPNPFCCGGNATAYAGGCGNYNGNI